MGIYGKVECHTLHQTVDHSHSTRFLLPHLLLSKIKNPESNHAWSIFVQMCHLLDGSIHVVAASGALAFIGGAGNFPTYVPCIRATTLPLLFWSLSALAPCHFPSF